MDNREPQRTILVTVPEAARRLSISRSALYNLINMGQIKPVRIGKSVRFSVDYLEEWVKFREHEQRSR